MTKEIKRKKIELIALDMDGTLLTRDGRISPHTQEVLKKAMSKGIHVVIATGRVFSAFPEDALNFSGIEYVVSSNGARVIRMKDKSTIYTNLIHGESAKQLIPYIFQEDLFLEIFYDGDVFVDKACVKKMDQYGLPQRYTEYMLRTRTQIDDIRQTMEDNIDKLENINVNFGSMDRKQELWEILSRLPNITATSSFPHNIEIGGGTTSKADGLNHLCQILNVKAESVMACGDNYNDLAMLNFAGISVAMGNAEDGVKSQVDFVTLTNEEDGVAHAIEQFVL